jgi:hypothetical protein
MTGSGPHREVAELQQEIAQTRAELAATVQELAGRVDVPARARAAWTHRTEPVRRSVRRARRSGAGWYLLAGVGVAAVVVTVLVVRGRRR